MTTRNARRQVLLLALPIMLSNVTVPLVGLVDTAVMGRMDSPAFLSATAVGAIVFSSLFWIFGFLRMGTGGMVAQALGAGDDNEIRLTAWRALLVGAAFGMLIIILSDPLLALSLWAMAGSAELHQLTGEYFHLRILAAPATLMLMGMLGTLIGQQRMAAVLVLQLLLNLLNIVLNLAFFNLTDWAIRGVAAATVISEYATLAVGLWLLHGTLWRRSAETPVGRLLDPASLRRFFRVSGNIFIRTLCLTFAFYWLTVIGSRQGDVVLAANAILLQMSHFMAHALDGFSHAAETLAGHALGRRDRQALIDAVRAATFWALIVAVLFSVTYAASGGWIIDTLTTQDVIRDVTRQWLPWIVLAPLTGVWSFLLDGIFIGTTYTREMRNGMLIALAVFLAATELLVPVLGNHGLWLSYHLLLVVRAATLGAWFPRVLAASEASGTRIP